MLFVLPQSVVIVGAARTPQGPLDGLLSRFSAVTLGAAAISAALQRASLAAEYVDECVMGNVVSAALMQAPAKQAAVAAGIPSDRPSKTVNTVCASGMTAVFDACLSLLSGISRIAVAGGMESRSNAPYYLGPRDAEGVRIPGKVRGSAFRLKTPPAGSPAPVMAEFIDSLRRLPISEADILDSLACPFCPPLHMKDYAAKYAEEAGISIEDINAAAAESYARARAASDSGDFTREIAPLDDVHRDDIISEETEADYRRVSYGYVTAYNAPALGDGASALVLMLEKTADDLGLAPLARITAFSRIETAPSGFVHAPVDAVREVSAALPSAATIVEANESFGLQIPVFKREFGADVINPYGGAVALAHPVGASGSRVIVTLLNAMRSLGHSRGIATTCYGSGGAMAVSIEAL